MSDETSRSAKNDASADTIPDDPENTSSDDAEGRTPTFPEEARQGRLEGDVRDTSADGSLREPQGPGSPQGTTSPQETYRLEGDIRETPADDPIPDLVEPAEHQPVRQPITQLYETPEPTTPTQPTVATTAELAEEPPSTPPAPQVQTIYITAPVPPRMLGNRGFGALLALAAAVVFAVLLAAVSAAYVAIAGTVGVIGAFTTWLLGFLASPLFYIPVAVFLVLFMLLVLILNRAGWWAYVLGSFLLAIAVYFASIGILLLIAGVAPGTVDAPISFQSLLVNPALIISAILAREVVIWFGAGISARGRRVAARNAEALAEHERQTAEKRAEFERAQYGTTV